LLVPSKAATTVVMIGLSAAACGQTAVSLNAETDYRFRGVSLSRSKPDARLNLDYDDPRGWYAGASATAAQFNTGSREAQWLAYLGWVQRAAGALGWEIGATTTHFAGDSTYDYAEAYVGLIAERWNSRAYVSPSYFGAGNRTVYAEVNGGTPLQSPWRVFAHLGALAATGSVRAGHGRRVRFDGRFGVAAAIGNGELQLAWVGAGRGGLYPVSYSERRQAWVLSAIVAF
jgi:uncharacterized protein (TIGR02001 family)